MDAVQKVGNGHPGTAMSLAPAAYLLFQRLMRHDPADPNWPGRDRFVLSCGHSSLTLYIQLYLSGYGLSMDDLKALRTWGSITPGHPEHRLTAGVEVTTGPLGQGIGNAVGMAMAARRERGLFDPDAAPGTSPFDHYMYCFIVRRGHRGGHQPRGLLAGRPPGAGQPDRPLRRQPDLHRGRHRHRLSPRTCARGTRPTAGTCRRWTGRPTGRLSRGRGRPVPGARGGQARHRRRRRSSRCGRSSPGPPRTSRTPARPTAPRSARDEVAATKEILRLRPGAVDFQVEDEVLDARPRGRSTAARGARGVGAGVRRAGRKANPERPALFDRIVAGAAARRLGRRAAGVPGRRQGRGHPQGVRRGAATRSARCCPSCGAARPTWPGRNNTTIEGEPSFLPADHQTAMWPGDPYGRTLHFGIREHAHGRDPERHRAARRRPAPTAARSCRSPTTCAPPCGWPR